MMFRGGLSADAVSVQMKTRLSIKLRPQQEKKKHPELQTEIGDARPDDTHTSYLKRKEKRLIVLRKSDKDINIQH